MPESRAAAHNTYAVLHEFFGSQGKQAERVPPHYWLKKLASSWKTLNIPEDASHSEPTFAPAHLDCVQDGQEGKICVKSSEQGVLNLHDVLITYSSLPCCPCLLGACRVPGRDTQWRLYIRALAITDCLA